MWGGRAEAPLWTSAPLSPSARGAFPVRAKTFLYPTMVPTKWHPAVGAGGIVQEVVDCSALGTGVKKLGKKITFFRARGEQAIVLARRPNIDSESAIWWRGGLPKQRPTAVGERGGGRDAGGSAVEKGELLFHIRATDDISADRYLRTKSRSPFPGPPSPSDFPRRPGGERPRAPRRAHARARRKGARDNITRYEHSGVPPPIDIAVWA